MRIRWWKSIRWHLALGSVSIVLVATLLLALTALFTIRYYYVDEQQSRLFAQARVDAQSIGSYYALSSTKSNDQKNLHAAANEVLSAGSTQPTDQSQPSIYVMDASRKLAYPPIQLQTNVSTTIVRLTDQHYTAADQQKLAVAIRSAWLGRGKVGEFGQRIPVNTTKPFCVIPIFSGGQSNAQSAPIGVLIATIPSTASATSFISTVGVAVSIATLVIVVLAAAGAIVFARTITRPLTKLTRASRVLASGDYSAQVSTEAPGEIGELAHSFNEMARQLKQDVDELRQQEIWRRELIMNITHDLATPLTAIAGLGEALVDGIDQTHEDYEATGRIIMNETLRLRRLVQDLHIMAKVETHALTPNKKALRLAALVDQVFATMITEFERHRVEPINEVPYDLPPIFADADMLTRVFANLCSNALRHTPAGGTIAIRTRLHYNFIIISVIDSGEGIPDTALTRIFERFYRADNARQSSTGGSGLGLAIVKAIIEAHGGSIRADNAAGGGACISFSLPMSAPATATTAPLPSSPQQIV